MRLRGYRVKRVEENIDTKLATRKFVSPDGQTEYHLFNIPITVFPDDTLETCYGEEIKAGRRVNECIGYCTVKEAFDTFLVKLIHGNADLTSRDFPG